MWNRRPRSSEIRRAVLLGIAAAALAHLAPLHLAQSLDEGLLGAFAHWLPDRDEPEIVLIDMRQPGAMAALSSGPPVTIVGPNSFVLGPVTDSPWAEAGAWIFAIGGLLWLLRTNSRHKSSALLLGAGGPVMLVAGSAVAFSAAATWVPVTGPALLLLATGLTALTMLRNPVMFPNSAEPANAGARTLLLDGDLVEAWRQYREMPPTAGLLDELCELGAKLAAEGYPELAADVWLRVALVDPEYRNIARRLVEISRPEAFSSDAAREYMRTQMPATVGRYKLLEPIGQGTTGRVFLARDPSIQRLLAIKLIDLTQERDAAEVADAREGFRREAETTGRLSHPNIVTIHDMGESDGHAYIAMEYLKGTDLSQFTAEESLLPARLIAQLGALTADALDYAHSQNVIHRDIKPGNIMYDSISGDLKITDFGIARLIDVQRTRTGVVLGTPSFMAPEQIEGGNVKGYTDLFALGVSLYELLTGQLPFRGNSMTKLMFVIANEPHEPVSAVRPGLPVEIDRVIDIALKKDPVERFQRGADMADALRAAARQMA